MSQFAGEGELDINWAIYKEWPEGLIEEERLLLVSTSSPNYRNSNPRQTHLAFHL